MIVKTLTELHPQPLRGKFTVLPWQVPPEQGPGDISESPVSGKANVLILSTTHTFLLSRSFTVGLLLLLQDPQSPWLKWNGIVGSLQTMNFISLVSVHDLPQKLETYLQGTPDQYSCAGLWCSGLKSFSLESGALTIRKSM